jgi:ABC-type sugar transport system permease subunit
MTADYNVFLFTNGNGDNETATVGYLLYKITLRISENTAGKPYYGYPAALGVALTFVSAPVVLIGKYFIERKFEGTEM